MSFFNTLILDCDGVIVDSEALSCSAWNIVFQNEYKIDIGTDYKEILGGTSKESAEFYLRKYNLPLNDQIINLLCSKKEKAFLELAKGNLKPIKGINSVIMQAKSMNWKVAVASSGILSKIQFSLKQVNLLNEFDLIVSSENILRSKPFPDIYLEVANHFSVKPSFCIVIEDTPKGIAAAKNAGMFVVAITTTFIKKELMNADLVLNSFNSLNLTKL